MHRLDRLDGWMDLGIDGSVEGWTDGPKDGLDGQAGECMQMDQWMDKRIDK